MVDSDISALTPHLDAAGRLTRMPAKRRVQLLALEWLAARLGEPGQIWTERDITNRIAAQIAFDDPVRLRRDLVDAGFLRRETGGNAYWIVATTV